jgi:hypothetical protein
VSGQRAVRWIQSFGGDGTQLGEFAGRRLTATGQHQIGALAVIVFRRIDSADQAQVLHLLGRFGQKFADVNAGH